MDLEGLVPGLPRDDMAKVFRFRIFQHGVELEREGQAVVFIAGIAVVCVVVIVAVVVVTAAATSTTLSAGSGVGSHHSNDL